MRHTPSYEGWQFPLLLVEVSKVRVGSKEVGEDVIDGVKVGCRVSDGTTTRSPLQHPRNSPQLAELTVLRLSFCFNNWEVEDLRLKIELGFVKGKIAYYFDPRDLPPGYFIKY